MKIVGGVNDYKEALEIEEVVKVFIVEKRILNLLSIEKKKNFENADSNIMIFPTDNIQYEENSNKKISHVNIDEDSVPVFNVRGLI